MGLNTNVIWLVGFHFIVMFENRWFRTNLRITKFGEDVSQPHLERLSPSFPKITSANAQRPKKPVAF